VVGARPESPTSFFAI